MSKSAAYYRGLQDYYSSDAKNPYFVLSQDWDDWNDGWNKARKDYENSFRIVVRNKS